MISKKEILSINLLIVAVAIVFVSPIGNTKLASAISITEGIDEFDDGNDNFDISVINYNHNLNVQSNLVTYDNPYEDGWD